LAVEERMGSCGLPYTISVVYIPRRFRNSYPFPVLKKEAVFRREEGAG
jgi:hypothetical protein